MTTIYDIAGFLEPQGFQRLDFVPATESNVAWQDPEFPEQFLTPSVWEPLSGNPEPSQSQVNAAYLNLTTNPPEDSEVVDQKETLGITLLEALSHTEATLLEVGLAGQNNANSSLTGVPIRLGTVQGSITAQIAGSAVNTADNTLTLPKGSYVVFLDLSFSSNRQRTNMGVRHLINGVPFAIKSLGSYIRASSGHNESGGSLIDAFSLSETSQISFEIFRLASSGTVNLIGNQSRLVILKVSSQ